MKDKRIYGIFGPRIKAMRLEHGLKQRQLAELLETDGVGSTTCKT